MFVFNLIEKLFGDTEVFDLKKGRALVTGECIRGRYRGAFCDDGNDAKGKLQSLVPEM